MWKIILGGGIGLFVLLYVLTLTVPGFIMFGVVVFLFIMTIFLSYLNGGIKATGIAILVFAASFLAFTYYYNATCGPNSADVKVMKPMAEKISKYIMTKGIPESLKDIPELPYELEGCERKKSYYKHDLNAFKNIKINSSNDAEFKTVDEKCHFIKKKRVYYISLNGEYNIGSNENSVNIEIGNNKSETWDIVSFHSDKNKKIFMDSKIDFGSSKTSGICNPMKQ